MTEYRDPDHVTIVKERGGSGGTVAVALIAIVLIALAAFYLFARQPARNTTDPNISAAAQKVGDAAEKVGNAAEDAAKKVN